MKLRPVLIGVGVFAAAVVFAQAVVVGAAGRGVAMNEQNQGGSFRFEATKRQLPNNPNPRVEGNFRFERMSQTASERFVIESRVRELGVTENVAEFAGPAVLMRRGPNGQPIRIEGRLIVRVEDNRNPQQPDPNAGRDKLAWRFVRPNSNDVLEFAGGVRDGDIKVFRRN